MKQVVILVLRHYYFNEAKSFFGWEQDDKLIGFLNLGVVADELKPGKRKPVSEKIKWIR